MCGAFHLVKETKSLELMTYLGTPGFSGKGLCLPASNIEIVIETKQGRECRNAKWWLLLDKSGKPNYQYATFNSRSDKLGSSFLTKKPFKTSRCIIPACSVIDGQANTSHRVSHQDNALALGGLYKTYQVEGELITSASIITCPGNPKWSEFHAKSTPLMLDTEDSELIDMWLAPSFQHVEAFDDAITGRLAFDLEVTAMAGARDMTAIAEPFICSAD